MMRPSKGIGVARRRRIQSATMHLSLHNRASSTRARPGVQVALITAVLAALALGPQAQAKPKEAGASSAAEATADTEPHPVLDRIRSSGRIVLAHRETSVPFSYYDANKKPIGFAVDLCKDLAETIRKHLGMKTLDIVYLPVSTATRIQAVVDGKADLECGTTTNNAERREKVAFTVPHYVTGSRYVVRADSPISELDQFEDHVLVST